MSNNEKNTISEDDLESVTGGKSDYSQNCGAILSTDCMFCIWQHHNQGVFDGVLKDTVGCAPAKFGQGKYGYVGSPVSRIWVNAVATSNKPDDGGS